MKSANMQLKDIIQEAGNSQNLFEKEFETKEAISMLTQARYEIIFSRPYK